MSAVTTARATERARAKQVPLSINRDSPVPLYHQLSEQLARAIDEGVLQRGEAFETEMSMSERLDISRLTVQRSIAELVTRGLLIRRRGVGTTVAFEADHRGIDLTSLDGDQTVNSARPTTRVIRLDFIACDKRAAEALRLDAQTPLVFLERLQMVDGRPFALLKNWLPPQFAALSVGELEARGPFELLRENGSSPAVAHHSVGSRPALPEERRLLGLGRFDSVLTMTRRAFDAGGSPLEFADHCYRADRYTFDVTVTPVGTGNGVSVEPEIDHVRATSLDG